MKKGKIIQYIVAILVVFVLLCGIFSIVRRITGKNTTENVAETNNGKSSKTKDKEGKKAEAEEDTEAEADNSTPITKLKVTAPKAYIREGNSMDLEIKYKPADASNPKLKWSCSEKGLVSVSEDGKLTAEAGSGKNKVTVTAKTTDGSNIEESFELRILPAIDPSKPMVAITFDDGPNPSTTNTMLDVLEENYALATFFCLGTAAEKYPEVVQREYELGMEVGTHTYAHKDIANSSEAVIDEEISKGVKTIEDAIGVKPTLMRPPYGGYPKGSGKMDPRILATAKQYGLSCINWSVDTEDWRGKSPDFTYQAVMKVEDGDIVLLHDIHQYNVDAVKRFVPDLMEQGFQLLTVSELYETFHELNESNPNISKEVNDMDILEPGTKHMRPEKRIMPSESDTEDSEAEATTAAANE
jgi:peptidoglycan/xylan/chitin deacetylase (PgdA/CDA1 family)